MVNFPDFDRDSKLTLVANFQTPSERPTVTGQIEFTVSSLGGALYRQAALASGTESEELAFNPCGYPEVEGLTSLMGRSDSSAPTSDPQIRARYEELAEGTQKDFYLYPAFRSVTAEKILEPHETEHCTIFAEVVNGHPVIDRAKALAVAEAFDRRNPQRPESGIYDQVRAVFGSEWNQNPVGGNDGDLKIVIFFFSSETLGANLYGFVSPVDSDPDGGGYSNKAEIIYINGDKDLYQTLSTVSHEFQHVINLNEKLNRQGQNPSNAVDENISINEGMSGLAEEVCGYTLESGNSLLALMINNYLIAPEEHEFFNFYRKGVGYGQSYLFLKYVREHFGDQTIRAISTDTRVGMESLDANIPIGFPEAFRRWSIANYTTNLSGSVPSIYRYPSGFQTDGSYPAGVLVGVRQNPVSTGGSVVSGGLYPWSVAYYTVEGGTDNGVSAKVKAAEGSPYGLVFEKTADHFTSLHQQK